MIHPLKLIGIKYRLGSNPEQHGTADCVSLARAVLSYQGIEAPPTQRSWYRRLKNGDYSVFPEQLNLWGERISVAKIGSLALCQTDDGYGLASYFEGGWIAFSGIEAAWSPAKCLSIAELYYQRKRSYATPLGLPKKNIGILLH